MEQVRATDVFKKYIPYFIFLIVGLFLFSWINSPLIVTVTGTGEVTAKAETATLTFSLTSNGDSPQSAISAVKSNVDKIKQTLKTNGISESDIYESQVSVFPASAVKQDATGFQATVSMGVKTSQVNNLDGLTSALYSLGAIVVTQPVLSVGDVENLEKEAYNLAIKDAKSKARSIALSNFKLLKKVILIEQSKTQPTSTVTTKAGTIEQVDKNLSPDDGLIKISKVVSVSYKMW